VSTPFIDTQEVVVTIEATAEDAVTALENAVSVMRAAIDDSEFRVEDATVIHAGSLILDDRGNYQANITVQFAEVPL
jgi:hypothetical protein